MGLLGLILAMVGLYGLMSYSVSLRAREIGIRMAIGAGRSGVLGMVMKQGMVLAAAGVSIGLLLCLLASKAVTAVVGVPSFNLPFVALVTAGLVAAAALGAYVPARRASRLDRTPCCGRSRVEQTSRSGCPLGRVLQDPPARGSRVNSSLGTRAGLN
jgi:ABC-type antimicrobial peptide transport system permease subunit